VKERKKKERKKERKEERKKIYGSVLLLLAAIRGQSRQCIAAAFFRLSSHWSHVTRATTERYITAPAVTAVHYKT
jgi:hypothetical protein